MVNKILINIFFVIFSVSIIYYDDTFLILSICLCVVILNQAVQDYEQFCLQVVNIILIMVSVQSCLLKSHINCANKSIVSIYRVISINAFGAGVL